MKIKKQVIDLIDKDKQKNRIFRSLALSLCMLTFTSISAQTGKVSIDVKDASVKELFSTIEKQSQYRFSYRDVEINGKSPVTLSAKNEELKDLLTRELTKLNLVYRVSGNKIIVMLKQASESNGRPITLKGVVKDAAGEPLVGVTVMLASDRSIGTVTDLNGNFTLPNVPEGKNILVSYIGYAEQNLPAHAGNPLNIILKEDTQTLDEVVVVAYGTQKKVNLTGAVETVNSKTLENRPIKSATDALQGAISGLTVSSGSGEPGTFSSFKIRGNTSVNSAGALVIIDGLPGSINLVNPQDIESISVLKDAASAAIYGARAAEGVVLVTTRSGKSEKVRIEYSGNIAFNTPTRLPKSNTGIQHALMTNEAYKNAGLSVPFSEDAIKAFKDPSILAIPNGNDWTYTSNTDWISLMMDHSFQQTHNLTISKADKSLKYLFSAGWLDQNGMFVEYGPDNYDRINLRSNITLDIIPDKLSLDSKITYVQSNKLYHPQFTTWSIPYITLIQSGPNMPIYDPNGNFARHRMQANPIQAMEEGGEGRNRQQTIEGIFTLSYKPLKGLTLKAIGGGNVRNRQIKEWRKEYGKYGPNGLISMGAGQYGANSVQQTTETTRYLTGQLMADYKLRLGKNDFNLLGGWSVEENLYEDLYADRTNIVGNSLPALKLGSTDGWTNNANENEWALISGFMRLNYAYADKYLFEANFRADASSRFSKKNRWGIFPSFSVGWRISEEEFMKDQKIFSNLKIRASWGQLGNQNGLGLYDHIAQYKISGYYPFASGLGQWAIVDQLPSEDRTWETVEMTNIALDMGFLNNKLSVTGEYFIKRNKNMLVNIEVPSVIGIAVPTGNYGELDVRGWDFTIGWNDHIGDFNYSARFNLSDQRDKLVSYGADYNGFTAGVNQRKQGYSLGSIFGYVTDGYFTSEEEVKNSAVVNRSVAGMGDLKYIDQDKDGKISAPNDLKYLGTMTPRYVFGLTLNASWKEFDFGAVIQGVGKRNYYLDIGATAPFYNTWNNFSYKMHNDYWTPDNLNATMPRPYAGGSQNYVISDHWMQNAAYARMKNVQVGYSFKKSLIGKAGIERLRLYFSGENLFEFSKLNKSFDPELSSMMGDMYPIMRTLSFGVNLTF